MPELPEVQTVVNDLQRITGDTITGFHTDWKRAISTISPAVLEKKITGKKIISVRRLSKFIVLDLSSRESLLLHLRMTGQLLINNKCKNTSKLIKPPLVCRPEFISGSRGMLKQVQHDNTPYTKHLHHIFYLKKNGSLEFHDIRKFGTISLRPTSEIIPENFKLGIDPFDNNFTASHLSELLRMRPGKPIKDLLLDQSLISGIGNIYASEMLFDCKILPSKKAAMLSTQEIKGLYKSIKKILNKAIRMRGTSVSDYRDGNGKKGSFQKVLRVYKKHGQKCVICGTIIAKSIIGQRSTFYCPKCQK